MVLTFDRFRFTCSHALGRGLALAILGATLQGCGGGGSSPDTSDVTNPPGGSGNRAPTVSGSPPVQVAAGQAYSFTPAATDPDGDRLTFTVQNKPDWLVFDPATGRLSGTPTAEQAGTYANIAVSVSDGSANASLAAFTITVGPGGGIGTATLSWQPPTTRSDGSSLGTLSGYRIRYGNSPDSFPYVIEVTNPGITRFVVENLGTGTYYFVVSAYDTQGLESSNSNAVSKTIS